MVMYWKAQYFLDTVLVFYCVRNYHKFSNLKQYKLTTSQFYG